MNWFTKILGIRPKAEWRMCKQVKTVFVSHHDSGDKEYNLSYYLHENQYGERKFDIVDSMHGDRDVKDLRKDDIAYRLKAYRETVKPWLDGRLNPEIPTYDQVPVDDFKTALKGKK